MRGIIIFVLLILLVVGISMLSRMQSVTIRDVTVSGNSITATDDIVAAVEGKLDGNDWLLFPKKNFLIYPKRAIEESLRSQFPALRSVSVALADPHTLGVRVTERTPQALWCRYDGTLPQPLTDNCYLMDAAGFVYLKAPEFKGNAYMRYYGLIDPAEPVGQNYLPDSIAKISAFVDGVRDLGLSPSAISVLNGEYDLYLADGGRIIFDPDADYNDTLLNLATLIQNNATESGSSSSIDYIDLRYGNKVYYKFKDGSGNTPQDGVSR
jgi:cell division septal protein FtsQ